MMSDSNFCNTSSCDGDFSLGQSPEPLPDSSESHAEWVGSTYCGSSYCQWLNLPHQHSTTLSSPTGSHGRFYDDATVFVADLIQPSFLSAPLASDSEISVPEPFVQFPQALDTSADVRANEYMHWTGNQHTNFNISPPDVDNFKCVL
jgi:hypothetical protein